MNPERPDHTAAADPGAAPASAVMSVPGGRDRRRLWLWLLAAALVAAGAVYGVLARAHRVQAARAKAPAVREVPVVGASAHAGDLGVYVNGLGTVTPLRTVVMKSRVDGELVDVAYREGQLVREGDLLARIDPRPFEVQLMQAEGQLARDEAVLKNARLDLERYQTLMKEDSIPRQLLDTQAATVSQLEASLKTDRAAVESAKLNLTYCRITSPVSGKVGLRLVDPGNMVKASDANGLVVITQMNPITVLFTIPADRLPAVLKRLEKGSRLVVEAWDRDLKTQLATGSVLAVDNQIDPTTGTVRIKALFSNEDLALFPNQFVNARLLVDTVRGAVLIPAAAIQRSPQSTFVYAVKGDSTVEMRNVDVKLIEGDMAAVASGVAAGDVVVVDGIDKLQPGARVALAGATKKPVS